MLRVVRLVMIFAALMVLAALTLALHRLLPDRGVLMAWLDFIALGISFLFALSVLLAAMLIGGYPGRSKLGQRLNDKVNQQERSARDVYQAHRQRRRAEAQGTKETTMRPQAPE